jgi:hypothetical protein
MYTFQNKDETLSMTYSGAKNYVDMVEYEIDAVKSWIKNKILNDV